MKLYLNCDPNIGNVAFTKKDYLLYAANKLGINNIVDYQGEKDVEYVLNIEPYSTFVKGTKWTGIWEIDLLMDRLEMKEENWEVADTIFIAISTIPKRMEKFRDKTKLLFQACEPDFHKYDPTIDKKYDFVLAGTQTLFIYKEREKAIQTLIKSGFSFADLGKNHAPKEYGMKLNKARVQFIRSMKTKIADGEIAQRFFECLAIGPVLTNRVEDLKKTGLKEGEDFLAYGDEAGMIRQMRDLINTPHYADKIAEAGRKKALTMHTYENRLQEILTWIQNFQ